MPKLPERVVDTLLGEAGVSTYHPDGDQNEALQKFAELVIGEWVARQSTPEFTDRDINLLKSCSDWLDTRADWHAFKSNKELMQGYAKSLRNLRARLEPVAVPKPVTMDELFGKAKDD